MSQRRRIVIVGGGSAGIDVAARLRRAGEDDVTVVEPSRVHYYQPLYTLVGAGLAPPRATVRATHRVMPEGVRWVQDRVVDIDPEARTVGLEHGDDLGYDFLVVAPGIQLDWDRIPGLTEAMDRGPVSSNYTLPTAERMWDLIKDLRGGTAVFTAASGPTKCGGAPQKIAYLAADHWRRRGVLDDIHVILVLPAPKLFGVPVFNATLEKVVDRYGIDVRFQSEATEVDADGQQVIVTDLEAGGKDAVHYDLMHVVPKQSAPDWVKATPLAMQDEHGFVEVDGATLQHVRYPEVFALGDASGSPNAKTGAAVRKQAPVVVENLRAVMVGGAPTATYDGYSSCPIVTAHNRMLLCEFDYTGEPHPTIPIIDTTKERYDMWLLKRWGLPFLYWHGMLKGLV